MKGLRTLYERVMDSDKWTGPPLKSASNGHPLTHDILERLGALVLENEIECNTFEDDFKVLQRRASLQEHAAMSPRPDTVGKQPPSKRPCRTSIHVSESSIPKHYLPPTPPDLSPTGAKSTSFSADFGAEPAFPGVTAQTHNTWPQCLDFDPEIQKSLGQSFLDGNIDVLDSRLNPFSSMPGFNEDDMSGYSMSDLLSQSM